VKIRFKSSGTLALGSMDEGAALLSSPLATGAAALIGAIWGSFFNVCIARIPAGQSIVRPGSRCASCGTPIRAWDNIPLVSYFVLRGRCRACKAPFSARYPLVEALAALLAAALWLRFVADDAGDPVPIKLARFAVYFAFGGVLMVLSFIDLATHKLPNVITLPAIPILFLSAFGAQDVEWLDRLIGAVAGYLFFRIVADFCYYVLKREGLGLGDTKLLALIGAVLGWRSLFFVVFVGSLGGALISLPFLLRARRRQTAANPTATAEPLRQTVIPYGPFLAGAALLYLFTGPALFRLLLGE
jgi:leader peptidase (prepilin peptidase)/N-methyltransferase